MKSNQSDGFSSSAASNGNHSQQILSSFSKPKRPNLVPHNISAEKSAQNQTPILSKGPPPLLQAPTLLNKTHKPKKTDKNIHHPNNTMNLQHQQAILNMFQQQQQLQLQQQQPFFHFIPIPSSNQNVSASQPNTTQPSTIYSQLPIMPTPTILNPTELSSSKLPVFNATTTADGKLILFPANNNNKNNNNNNHYNQSNISSSNSHSSFSNPLNSAIENSLKQQQQLLFNLINQQQQPVATATATAQNQLSSLLKQQQQLKDREQYIRKSGEQFRAVQQIKHNLKMKKNADPVRQTLNFNEIHNNMSRLIEKKEIIYEDKREHQKLVSSLNLDESRPINLKIDAMANSLQSEMNLNSTSMADTKSIKSPRTNANSNGVKRRGRPRLTELTEERSQRMLKKKDRPITPKLTPTPSGYKKIACKPTITQSQAPQSPPLPLPTQIQQQPSQINFNQNETKNNQTMLRSFEEQPQCEKTLESEENSVTVENEEEEEGDNDEDEEEGEVNAHELWLRNQDPKPVSKVLTHVIEDYIIKECAIPFDQVEEQEMQAAERPNSCVECGQASNRNDNFCSRQCFKVFKSKAKAAAKRQQREKKNKSKSSPSSLKIKLNIHKRHKAATATITNEHINHQESANMLMQSSPFDFLDSSMSESSGSLPQPLTFQLSYSSSALSTVGSCRPGGGSAVGPFPGGDPSDWSCEQVYDFVRIVAGSAIADTFKAQDLDGLALSLIKDDHLVQTMQVKLGPALKIMSKFNELKKAYASECVNKTF